jgi:hypothetical protein
MNRRIFLKATGAGLVHPAGLLTLGPALVRRGNRRLKDITPDELMELLAWAEIDLEDVTTVEDMARERGRPIVSLHPQYWFHYCEGKPDVGRPDSIWFRYWPCVSTDDDISEYDQADGCIEIGGVWAHGGYPIATPVELVKWFLSHGFKVW